MSDLKRTQLYDVHTAAGAAMVDFGDRRKLRAKPFGISPFHTPGRFYGLGSSGSSAKRQS